jgi:hypothetical protein
MHEDANMHSCNKVEACDSLIIIPFERDQLTTMLLSTEEFFKTFFQLQLLSHQRNDVF